MEVIFTSHKGYEVEERKGESRVVRHKELVSIKTGSPVTVTDFCKTEQC